MSTWRCEKAFGPDMYKKKYGGCIMMQNHGGILSGAGYSYNPQIKWMCVKNNKLVSNKSA